MAKKKAEAHHGGAWKVAYADFVTAMMALFMVLWITAQDNEILIATSRYFQQPFNSPLKAYSGIMDKDSNKISSRTSTESSSKKKNTDGSAHTDAREIDLQFLNSLAKDFYRLLHLNEDLEDKPIDIQVTTDGMRITLFDRARKPLFKPNSTEFTEWGNYAMQNMAWLVDRYAFHVVIEGHTRKGMQDLRPDYTAWELSADRANAARRALTHYAVDPSLIERVTGFADTRPVPLQPAESDSNQRISLSLSLGVRPAKALPAAIP